MPDNSSRLPTIRDVAELARVSASTVSYVLNGRGGEASRISPETHERVLAAVNQLGYIQNNTARHLRRRTTERVCLALPSLGRPYHDELAQQLSQTAREFGYSVVVSVGGTLEQNIGILNDVRSGLADGIILDINDTEDDRIVPKLEELANSRIAVIVLGSKLSGKGFDVMDTTEGQAVVSAVAYLIGRGHRRIAYLAHQLEDGVPIGQRYRSYARALDEAGIPLDPKLIVEGAASREGVLPKRAAFAVAFDAADRDFLRLGHRRAERHRRRARSRFSHPGRRRRDRLRQRLRESHLLSPTYDCRSDVVGFSDTNSLLI